MLGKVQFELQKLVDIYVSSDYYSVSAYLRRNQIWMLR